MSSIVSKSYVYNAECPVCGIVYKSTEMKKRWDGLWVCKADWETRHPSDFYKPKNDVHKLPFVLPEQETNLTPTNTTDDEDPTDAPASEGLYWFNTKTGVTFKSTGTATVADWTRIN